MTRPLLTALRPLAVLLTGVLLVAGAAALAGDRADAVSPESTDVVFVAAGYNYPDALVGAVVATSHNAPVLTVRGPDAGDRVPEATADELTRLEPEQIVILGGEAAVSAAVETELGTYTDPEGNTSRLRGDDRFGTAAAISQAIPDKVRDADNLDGLDSGDFARDLHSHRVTLSRALDPSSPVSLTPGLPNAEILVQEGVNLPDVCGDDTARYNVRVDASGTIIDDDDADTAATVGIDDPSDESDGIAPTSERNVQFTSDKDLGNFATQLLMSLPEGDHAIALEGNLFGGPGDDAEVQNATMMIEVLGYTCPISLPVPTPTIEPTFPAP